MYNLSNEQLRDELEKRDKIIREQDNTLNSIAEILKKYILTREGMPVIVLDKSKKDFGIKVKKNQK